MSIILYHIAAALYEGGWREGDYADLIKEYDFSPDEAAAVCKIMAEIDRQ